MLNTGRVQMLGPGVERGPVIDRDSQRVEPAVFLGLLRVESQFQQGSEVGHLQDIAIARPVGVLVVSRLNPLCVEDDGIERFAPIEIGHGQLDVVDAPERW